jgi:hypothetical protein
MLADIGRLLFQHHQIAAGLVGDLRAQRARHADQRQHHLGVDLEAVHRIPVRRFFDRDHVGVVAADVQRHAPRHTRFGHVDA